MIEFETGLMIGAALGICVGILIRRFVSDRRPRCGWCARSDR